MVLKNVFNRITQIHSRAVYLKRLGTPNIYSPARITPSNFFRFLEGPSNTVIHGREFIIPIDTMKGEQVQLITFDEVPTSGTFTLDYEGDDTDPINFDDTAADVQIALREIAALAAVVVTGDFEDGFSVQMSGVEEPTTISVDDNSLDDVEILIALTDYATWSPMLKRADRIVDSIYGTMAIDEIIEIPDLGGSIMGYRVRVE